MKLKSIILVTFICFFSSIPVFAQDCHQVSISTQKACSTEFFVANKLSDFNAYLQQGKFKDGKLLNLRIDFNLQSSSINFDVPCSVTLAPGRSINSNSNNICVKALKFETEGLNSITAGNAKT